MFEKTDPRTALLEERVTENEHLAATDTVAPARRDQVVAQLGAAWAAETIDEPEMERRMAAAFAAREPADLERLVADLPAAAAVAAVVRAPVAHPHHASNAMQPSQLRRVVLGSVEERVTGVVPARLELGARLGNFELDFSQADFANDVTEIVVDVVLGNIELRLPADLIVEIRVDSVLASVEFHDERSMAPRSGRTVRVTGSCWLGNVEVTAVGGR
jgi:Domain of unknown function (DUF1707)/Cell wall-active antibiotics response 4TMS YvqF